jgi:NADH dehydrogenase (ubiquinone) 1 beta subcomplex subunit 3
MSSPTARRDPWAKLHAWRNHSIFQGRNQLRSTFPGLGIATVAFAAYCLGEWAFSKKSHKSVEGGHH